VTDGSAEPIRPPLVDSHAHLQSHDFDDDAADVLANARAGGLARILVPAWNLRSTRLGLEFARANDVPTSAGIHPHDASSADEASWAEIVALARQPEVVAIGETGLDFDRLFSSREEQVVNLRRHLDLAVELAKPLVIHCRSAAGERDAQDLLIAELRSAGVGEGSWRTRFGNRPPGVLHSFSGPVDYAEAALALGFAVSFSGLVFRGGEEASAEVARLVPRERLLTETDSPFLKPRGIRGRRNEPRHVAVTASWLAEQRGVEPAILGAQLVASFDRFVGATT
jgi:TatD DNase family protein